MSKEIFFTSMIVGPMISGVSFTMGSFIGALFDDFSGTIALAGNFVLILMWSIFLSYMFIFVSMFNGGSVIVPILIYSVILSVSVKPYLDYLSDMGLSRNRKVVNIIFLSVLVGMIVYGLSLGAGSEFFKDRIQEILFVIVLPTSLILGAWFGFSELCKASDEAEITAAVTEQEENKRKNILITEHQERVKNIKDLLRSKDYRLKSNGNGWIVYEPLGGRPSIDTLDELEQYAISRDEA
jgi:hypothetical protein